MIYQTAPAGCLGQLAVFEQVGRLGRTMQSTQRIQTGRLVSRLGLIGLSLVLSAGLCANPMPTTRPEAKASPQPGLAASPATGEAPTGLPANPTASTSAGPVIRDIHLNAGEYPGGQIPAYSKLEITFQVDTEAANLQLPYDAAPPAGVQPGVGISVDALFTPDDWQTVYRQPAFYYQEFLDEVREEQEWFYPSGSFSWKVRFSPPSPGSWQFRLAAQDAEGATETQAHSFSVAQSDQKGFVRVSRRDARYFEFEDGAYFPALGYNMNFDHVSWNNPVLDNEANFQAMSQNGIQLARIWLSEWGIYGPSWNPWNSIDPELHGQYIPFSGLTFNQPFAGSDVAMRLEASRNPCMFLGFIKAPPAVLPDTRYRVRVRYRLAGVSGPRVAEAPYGLAAKTGDWLWGEGKSCQDTGSGRVVTPYRYQDTADWQILEGSLVTGDSSFLPYFYLTLENVSQGSAFIDTVWIEEDRGDGQFGPNILPKPWMAHHLYMEQRNSYAFDKVLELAGRYGIYLRPVVMEKNDWIFNRLNQKGEPIAYNPGCEDQDPSNDPPQCPGNNWFYGPGRGMSKVRWLQQAWWRYLQARWGYSTAIQSWELINEGDPNNELHYLLADEFGKYMHQFGPNQHLVSTSFWHSFPRSEFWANPAYPEVDFADIHRYVDQSSPGYRDTALSSYSLSLEVGAKQPGGAGKPVIRGETGFTVSGSQPASDELLADRDGIWLHNFLWAGINAGGMIEAYWYETYHIYNRRPNGGYLFDHRPQFGVFYNFIRDIPLNNGLYQDAQASPSSPRLRVLGQKDLVNGRAHLWIQNVDHTWKNVVDGAPVEAVSGTIRISGFTPGQTYLVYWWDPYALEPARQVTRTEQITAQADQTLILSVDGLSTDLAVMIQPDQTAINP
jgi:hypothetical protein